jgi:hypothetical protein
MSKSRTFGTLTYLGTEFQDGLSGWPKDFYYYPKSGRESLFWTAGHYGYPDFPIDRNVGGDFWVAKDIITHNVSSDYELWYGVSGGAANQHYKGSFVADIGTPYGWLDNPNEDWTAAPYAPALYNKLKPTKPTFPGLNALWELREVPGMLRQRFLDQGLQSIGNYWLALQFGWKPLLNDCMNLVLTQQKAQARLKQLIRDNGKPVRRATKLFENKTTTSFTEGYSYAAIYPSLVTQYHDDTPYWSKKEEVTDRVWGSARFRYFLPEGPRDILWTTLMMGRIFGLNPTPLVVWNAMPWSWLIDWFTGASQVIANLEAGVADRLAAEYFYVMREQKRETTMNVAARYHDKTGTKHTVTATTVAENSIKTRLVGDPFGLHTPENGLSGMQLSILGALGLSRLR